MTGDPQTGDPQIGGLQPGDQQIGDPATDGTHTGTRSAWLTLTGGGEHAGTDHLTAQTEVATALGTARLERAAAVPYLPVLPARGPHARLLGATLASLLSIDGDLAPYGWRLGTGLGTDLVHARADRGDALDALALSFLGHDGPIALPATGPASLAASVYLPGGELMVSDAGARRDLADLLAEGLLAQADRVRHLVPGARPAALVHEPRVPDVLGGRLRSASGYRRHPAVGRHELEETWTHLTATLASGGVDAVLTLPAHGDALAAATGSGAGVLVRDASLPTLTRADGRSWWERLAELRESGRPIGLLLDPEAHRDSGRGPGDSPGDSPGGGLGAGLARFREAWRELGFSDRELRGLTLAAAPARRPTTLADLDALHRLAEPLLDELDA